MDPATEDGLIDLFLLCIALQLLLFFDPRYYASAKRGALIPADEQAEREQSLVYFSNFEDTFCQQNRLKIDGKLVDPRIGLFDPYLVQTCVAIVQYKELMNEFDDGFDHTHLLEAVRQHLKSYRPHLLAAFTSDFEKEIEDLPYLRSFSWGGPHFSVVPNPASEGEARSKAPSTGRNHGDGQDDGNGDDPMDGTTSGQPPTNSKAGDSSGAPGSGGNGDENDGNAMETEGNGGRRRTFIPDPSVSLIYRAPSQAWLAEAISWRRYAARILTSYCLY